MSFIIYFAVLLIAAASALFGLDLMTSPLPTMPNVPLGRTAHLVAPTKPETPTAKRADARALTPIYPAAPGGAAKQASTTGEAASATPPKTATDQVAAAQTAAAPHQNEPAVTKQTDVSQPAAKAAPAATQQAQNKCDVQTCAAAYHSFRASDCTYQPYQGPRQLCAKAAVASVAASSQPRQPSAAAPAPRSAVAQQAAQPPDDVDTPPAEDASPQVVDIVRRLSGGERDVAVQDADGRIVIVHAANARAQASCDVAACAAAYSSFNAADCTYRSYDGQRRLCEK